MTYSTVLFDLDGTLLNTLEDIADSVNYALETMDMPKRSLEEIRAFVGNGMSALLHRSVPNGTSKEDVSTCLDIYKKYYESHMRIKTHPYDGIIELINELKNRNIKMAVVSNKFDAAVKKLCKELFPDISVAIGESETIQRKPSPDCVYAALNELQVSKDTVLYVGDSEVDVQTAHNASLKCVGVTWGFRDCDVLKKAGADWIIDEPKDLLTII